jgi:myo-inositol-1(or 4)-monophosphatase
VRKSPPSLATLRSVAVEAARAGAAVVADARGRRTISIREKSPADYVTEVDLAAERAVVEVLRRRRPDDAVLGEEGTVDEAPALQGSPWRWVIDPLDGTTNFIHDLPAFAVSVGLERDGRPVVGAVCDVVRDLVYQAHEGGGAFVEGRRLRVSRAARLADAVVGTGIPFRNREVLPRYLPELERIARGSAGIRRIGAAALDLCWIAAGSLDGFWEHGLGRWDVCAGTVIVREAGGHVTDLVDGDGFLDTGDVAASNGLVHAELLATLAG